MIFETLSLILWAACPPLFIYGLFRRIQPLQYASALLFVLLLVDVSLWLHSPIMRAVEGRP